MFKLKMEERKENGMGYEVTSIMQPNMDAGLPMQVQTSSQQDGLQMWEQRNGVDDAMTAHQRELQRIRSRRRRARMTEEQKSLERERQRIRAKRRRESMSDEQRSLERERQQIRARRRREKMSDQKKSLERERQRVRARERRRNVGDGRNSLSVGQCEENVNDHKILSQRERRRIRDRERRSNMTEEQKLLERERRRRLRSRVQNGDIKREESAREREILYSHGHQGEISLETEGLMQGEEGAFSMQHSSIGLCAEMWQTKIEHDWPIQDDALIDIGNMANGNQDVPLSEQMQAEGSRIREHTSTVAPDVSGCSIEANSGAKIREMKMEENR